MSLLRDAGPTSIICDLTNSLEGNSAATFSVHKAKPKTLKHAVILETSCVPVTPVTWQNISITMFKGLLEAFHKHTHIISTITTTILLLLLLLIIIVPVCVLIMPTQADVREAWAEKGSMLRVAARPWTWAQHAECFLTTRQLSKARQFPDFV